MKQFYTITSHFSPPPKKNRFFLKPSRFVYLSYLQHRIAAAVAFSASRKVWSRKAEGRFPEAKELKQRVRDVLVPKPTVVGYRFPVVWVKGV